MYILLMILAILFNTVPRWIHHMYIWEHRSVFYIGQALSFIFVIIATNYKRKSTWDNRIYHITLWLAISNVMDELFFNPIQFGWNELIFAIGIIIYELFIYKGNESKRAL